MKDCLHGIEPWRALWDMHMYDQRGRVVKISLDFLIDIKERFYISIRDTCFVLEWSRD